MITTSEKWKEYSALHNVYHIKAVLTATDGTVLNLTDEDFMMGSVRISDACSSISSFDIGAVITNTFECTFNNTGGKFDNFDFRLATIAVKFGVVFEDGTEEWIDRGVYTLDKPSSLGYTIQARAYDNMDKLNRSYIGKGSGLADIVFPISSSQLAQELAEYCGVSFDSWQIPRDYTVNEFEYNESTTCREVLCWVCQINCAFARMTPTGQLEVRWYGSGSWGISDALDGGTMNPWNSADTADGGTMQPWSVVADIDGGSSIDVIFSQVARSVVNAEDIQITGIRVYVPNTVDTFEFATAGYNGYILAIEDNPLVTSENKDGIASTIYSGLKGMRFRIYDASVYGDPSIQAGDMIGVKDYLGRLYTSYITNLTYSVNGLMDVECGAETVTDRENEYSNPQTSTIQSAVTAAYDYIQAKKISADYITAGTLEAAIVAKDFTLEGGKVNIQASSETDNLIQFIFEKGNIKRVMSMTPASFTAAGEFSSAGQQSLATFYTAGTTVTNQYSGHSQYSQYTSNGMILQYDGTTQVSLMTNAGTGYFASSVEASSFINSSRLDLKKNLEKIETVLDKIKSADILSFNFKDESEDKKHIGLAIGGDYSVPEEVIATDDNGEEKGIDLYSMVSMAWKAIQEQQEIIEKLEARVTALEKKQSPIIKPIKDLIMGEENGNTN